VRVAKPDVDFQAAGKLGMTGHPGFTILGHALAYRCGQAFHLPGEAVESGPGTVTVRFAQKYCTKILHRTTKRVLRSTSVPTDERLKAPLIKSPSRWPGTIRASISLER
jgi:hypothetical protein